MARIALIPKPKISRTTFEDLYALGEVCAQCGDDMLPHACNAYWERWVKNSFTNSIVLEVTNFTDVSGNWAASATQIAAVESQEEALMDNTQ